MNENADINSAFFNSISGGFTMYTLNLSEFYTVLNQDQIKIANLFNGIVTNGNSLVSQIQSTGQQSYS